MPTSSSVHEQLTDILVRVVHCRADAVTRDASFKALGADSLGIVEVGEELGRRFDVYLSDDAIDSLVTVQDAIDAIIEHPTLHQHGHTTTALASPSPEKHDQPLEPTKAGGFVARFALAGIVIGALLGIAGAALVSATGIDSVDLPPIAAPTAVATTPTETPTPTPTPSKSQAVPEPSIEASSSRVSPGQRFILSGTFPGSDKGESLQVEVKEEGTDWDDFPIQTETRDGGEFKTELYTSRTGQREFRIANKTTNKTTPTVKVTIG